MHIILLSSFCYVTPQRHIEHCHISGPAIVLFRRPASIRLTAITLKLYSTLAIVICKGLNSEIYFLSESPRHKSKHNGSLELLVSCNYIDII
jgi:hypothetical protein